ncbi:hypothetical protein TEA_007611 [Camellia sinensis var. sinensis]|uniref:PAZ domain-containing protein n=1 Tax=Camellia sinensis var. sinensis TaxID=542762 RepID=A0A4S4DUT7_CAMSN|nr:hypothetical protein TEA_007611 [Camellia sinensis var. sinensis]
MAKEKAAKSKAAKDVMIVLTLKNGLDLVFEGITIVSGILGTIARVPCVENSDKDLQEVGTWKKSMEISYWTIFSLKVRNADGGYDGGEALQITVYDYFTKHHNIELTYSTFMPCLDVGKPKRPNYHPLEVLSSIQRASLVEKSRQKPQERIRVVTDTRNATGLVVLATAAGLGASTHTLGTLVPMIGAVAIAIGTVVGSFI